MFNIAICDNNKQDTVKMRTIVKSYMDAKFIPYQIYVFKSGEELLEFQWKLDLIFLDIAMDGINGIQAGKKLHEINRNVKIVYTTSYKQYCIQAVNNVHAFAYLEKPVTSVMAEKQLDEVMRYIQEEREKAETVKFDIIVITEEGELENKIKNFEVKDIIYFEYINRKIKIKLREEEYFFSDRMNSLAAKMQRHNFEICHQCYLVNLIHVKKIKGYQVYLDNNEKLPVSQKKSANFRKKLNKFIQDCI